ncbi:MAG: hypothetical protein PV340_05265 [Wolbachia sp.]|nr:hypothetical protein [Wolbachia sp.]MDD9336004.1 hypothetical protein [Wolbachia sp.]
MNAAQQISNNRAAENTREKAERAKGVNDENAGFTVLVGDLLKSDKIIEEEIMAVSN